MSEVWPELLLVAVLIMINAILAGSEIALISLRESQVVRLERKGRRGKVVAQLARDPNRFLATIQIGITLSGFLASAAAAITLAEPLAPYLSWFGEAADTVAVVLVTLILSFLTLILGELAPKRLALQKAERWALMVGVPLHWLAVISKPVVWLLSVATDAVVRLSGGEPTSSREAIDLEELREMVVANRALHEDHQEVLLGAFEVAERTLSEVLVPRPDVFVLDGAVGAHEGVKALIEARHSRAPVVASGGGLDDAMGGVSMRDLVAADPDSTVADHTREALILPESLQVLAALRQMQDQRQGMALVIDEFGGVAGIVTTEDLIEEVVGEIYDESDPDVLMVQRDDDGSIVMPGRFPVHDLVDLGIEIPEGPYTTVAGWVLDELGTVPDQPGDTLVSDGWEVTVMSLDGRAIDQVGFRPREESGDG